MTMSEKSFDIPLFGGGSLFIIHGFNVEVSMLTFSTEGPEKS